MNRIQIFISSVQKEFSQERVWICNYIRHDAMLSRFFDPFIFEEMPAVDLSVYQAYLSEVNQCDIYMALLGQSYGIVDDNDVSPTEKEFDNSLFLTGDIERAGTGISDMIDKCVSIGLKRPDFYQDESFKVILWRHAKTKDDIVNDIVNDMDSVRPSVRPENNLTEKQNAVLEFCSQARTPKEILAHISVKRHPDAIRLYIAQLVTMRLLKMTIPDKPTHPRQAYIRL